MPEVTLKCDDVNPAVYVTAECAFSPQSKAPAVQIVRVVRAADDGTPSEYAVAMGEFVRDMGVPRLEVLLHRFAVAASSEAELQHYRDKLFAALGLPSTWRKEFP